MVSLYRGDTDYHNRLHLTGPPRGGLKAVNIDMSSMTDTFMTVAVLAAVATVHNLPDRFRQLIRLDHNSWWLYCAIGHLAHLQHCQPAC